MNETSSIAYLNTLPGSQDYFFLRKEGIRMIQELCGDIWTDYNDHDPGVTILEQLCYALTDVAYRSNIDIEKLLSPSDYEANGLFFPEDILPTHPTTFEDYRACFLSQFRDEISNIWFTKTPGNIEGLIDVYVQTEREEIVDPASDLEPLVLRLKKYYSSLRNLSEDVHQVVVLKPQALEISARIDIGDKEIPEEVIAELYFQLEEFFNPNVKWNSLDSMRARGLDNAEIFNTASWHTGFLENKGTNEITPSFTLPSIHKLMSSVPGIRHVSELNIFKDGIKVNNEIVTIDKGYYARFAESLTTKDFHVYKKQNRISYTPEMVQVHLRQKIEAYTRVHFFPASKRSSYRKEYQEQLGQYTSVQESFPVNYGIGKNGLPSDVGPKRIEYARQLQSYLVFFDQILCNHLEQLKNIPLLFSDKEGDDHETYFTRVPEVPDFEKLTDGQLQNVLQVLSHKDFSDRRNRILDHFLSRFGVQFLGNDEYKLEHIWGVNSTQEILDTSIKLKSQYLKHARFLSKLRFKAIDYFFPEQNIGTAFNDNHNSYPFKRSLYYFLNLPLTPAIGYTSLMEHYAPFSPALISDEEKAKIQKEKNGSSFFQPRQEESKVRFVFPEKRSLDELAQYGSLKDSYSIVKEDNDYLLLFRTQQVSMELGKFSALYKAEEIRDSLVRKFTSLNSSSEGFHVVEHVLLRPFLESQYRLVFTIQKNRSAGKLKSNSSGDFESQKALAYEAILAGTSKESYEVISFQGQFSIYLRDANANRIMELDGKYSELDAKRWIEDMVLFFKALDDNRHPNPVEISYDLERLNWPEDQFFNFKLSLIIPAWVPRFNDADFKNIFDRMLAQNLPAHIHVKLIRVGIQEMKIFEREYKDWLDLRVHMFSLEKQYLISNAKNQRTAFNDLEKVRIQLDKKSLFLIDQFLLK